MNDRKMLRKAGFKLTLPRKMVLNFLKTGGHFSTKEIYDGLDKALGLTSVYRTLDLLIELGLAKSLFLADGSIRYEYIGDKKHHHHLVCTECGKICELDGCAITGLENKIAKNTAYRITHHTLELYGICPGCQQTQKQ